MIKTALILFIASVVAAQTPPPPPLPTLPAVNNIKTPAGETCSLQVAAGGTLFIECNKLTDGFVTHIGQIEPSKTGVVFGRSGMTCLYNTQDDGKNHLQCGDSNKILLNGIVPVVTRKAKWMLYWL